VKFSSGWKDAEEGGRLLWICILCGHRLKCVLRLRSRFISVSGTIEKSALMNLHLK